ncbi:hypothetical protein NHF46_12760 [Arthrobacter alpinus]|nr:hypothetical protein [Arthrobacter alpinus]
MSNAAHKLAEILTIWRSLTPMTAAGILAESSKSIGIPDTEMLEMAADASRRTNLMFAELQATGMDLGHFDSAKRSWSLAPFLVNVGWVAGSKIGPESVIQPHDLALLKAFGNIYDYAVNRPTPNRSTINTFILDLGPISDFVSSLDIPEASKALILTKIESTKTLLESEDFQFEVALTRLGEILGLLIILAESGLSEEDKATAWEKVRGFAANFGRDMTVNLVSGALASGFMNAIGS